MENIWIDDCFQVKKNPASLWVSEDKEGNKIITSHSEVSCISATRFYLKRKQEATW